MKISKAGVRHLLRAAVPCEHSWRSQAGSTAIQQVGNLRYKFVHGPGRGPRRGGAFQFWLARSSEMGCPSPRSFLTGRGSWRCRGSWFLSIILLAIAAAAVGCRRDMFQQPSSKPLEPSDFFQDNHMASRPLVPHTVARGHLNEDE